MQKYKIIIREQLRLVPLPCRAPTDDELKIFDCYHESEIFDLPIDMDMDYIFDFIPDPDSECFKEFRHIKSVELVVVD